MFPKVQTVPLIVYDNSRQAYRPSFSTMTTGKQFVSHLATEKDSIKYFVTICLYVNHEKTIYEWFSADATYKDIFEFIDFSENKKENERNYNLYEINNDNSETLLLATDNKLSGTKYKFLAAKPKT